MEGVDEPWRPTELQSQLAGEALKLQAEIDDMTASLAKAIHAAPPNLEGVRMMREAIWVGHEKMARIRAAQEAEQRRIRLERFGY